MAKQKLSSNLDQVMAELTQEFSKQVDLEFKLDIADRLLKYEALKLKAQQGAMGSGFDDEPDAA